MLLLSNVTLAAIMQLKTKLVSLLLCTFLSCSRSQISTGSPCTTPANEKSNCINIYDCPSILSVLTQKNISNNMKLELTKYSCGYDISGQLRVCCPSKPIVDIKNTTIDTSQANTNLLPANCGEATPIIRITQGDKASLYEFPWQVALKYESKKPIPYHCGGSLINKRYVLTAAHCIKSSLKLIGARIGEHDFSTEKDCVKLFNTMECAPPVQDFDISTKDAIVHPQYGRLQYDIALIRLPRDVEFNDAVAPICLPINENLTPKTLRNLTVVGWGNTENGTASSVLLKVTVPYQENSLCKEVFKRVTQIQDTQLCAGGKDGKDSCNGDSGGPIMVSLNDQGHIRTVQVGLVSFGHNECGKERFPGVYTRLTAYVDWILNNIKP